MTGRRTADSELADWQLDAAAALDAFHTHWGHAWRLIQTHQDRGGVGADDVSCVLNHADQLVTLVLWDMRRAPAATTSPQLLQAFLADRVPARLQAWTDCCGPHSSLLQLGQLRLYERLLQQSAVRLLAAPGLLGPLTQLLTACCGPAAAESELRRRLVAVLGLVCSALAQQPALLSALLSQQPEQGGGLAALAALADSVHWDGVTGQTAREALLHCMRLSADSPPLAEYIVNRSNFAPVVAAGLSALYSLLPRRLPLVSEDRYLLPSAHSKQVPELHSFLTALDFCNSVLQVCDPSISAQLLDYLYQGFLVSVLGPALHQNSEAELVTATAYLELCIRSVDQPGLVRALLRLLLQHRFDRRRIIDSLVQRIAATSTLCVATLSLLLALLELNCEDVMLELVLRHLLPSASVLVPHRASPGGQLELYDAGARRLLSLTPACCAPQQAEKARGAYLQYAADARCSVRACRRGCAGWTYRYDGADPPRALVTNMARRRFQSPPEQAQTPSNGHAAAARAQTVSGDAATHTETVTADDVCSIGESSGYQSFNPRPSPSPPPEPPEPEPPPSELGSVPERRQNLGPERDRQFWVMLESASTPPPAEAAPTADVSCSQLAAAIRRLSDAEQQQATSNPEQQATPAGPHQQATSTGPHQQATSTGPHQQATSTGPEQQATSAGPEQQDPGELGTSRSQSHQLLASSEASHPLASCEGSHPRDACEASRHLEGEALHRLEGGEASHPLEGGEMSHPLEGGEASLPLEGGEASSRLEGCEASRRLEGCEASHPLEGCEASFPLEGGEASRRLEGCEASHPLEGGEASHLPEAGRISDLETPQSPNETFSVAPNIGPFLWLLLERLEEASSHGLLLNLQLMSVVSRLCLYPQPLLTGFLLSPAVAELQSSVPTLLQTLDGLRERLDAAMAALPEQECAALMCWARDHLAARQQPTSRQQAHKQQQSPQQQPVAAAHNGSKGRLSLTSMASMLRRSLGAGSGSAHGSSSGHGSNSTHSSNSEALELEGTSFRYARRPSAAADEQSQQQQQRRRLALTAVLLRHWLLELAAIAQEHAVAAAATAGRAEPELELRR